MLPTLLALALSVTPHLGHAHANSSPAQITRTAKHFLGKAYVYGDEGLKGYDCSSFVQTVFRAHGVTLPRTSSEQSLWGQPVDLHHIQPGDLLFFTLNPGGKRITHVAIALDNDRIIHASRGRKHVVISKLDTRYFQDRLRVARRLGD